MPNDPTRESDPLPSSDSGGNDDVTLLVQAVMKSVPSESDMLRAAYRELRRIAGSFFQAQGASHTLQPTALVHEAFLKIAGRRSTPWEGESHFIAVIARAMRQVLIDHARAKHTERRGGDIKRVLLSDLANIDAASAISLDFHEQLERLAAVDERQAAVVELRFFAGLTVPQAAKVLGVSERTVELDWRFARAWLKRELHLEDP